MLFKDPPNKYYLNKIIAANRYNIYKDTKDLYKCIMIVEKSEDKASLKEMIMNRENNKCYLHLN